MKLYIFLLFVVVTAEAAKGKKKKVNPCRRDCFKYQNKTVCGTDDQRYDSLCELKKQNCLKNTTVAEWFRGECDCPQTCGKEYEPVCSSQNKTLLNVCKFRKEACRLKKEQNIELKLLKKGPCKPWKKNKASCPVGCADIWAPICAKNGKTYSSICALKIVWCKKNEPLKGLKLQKIGECKKGQCPEFCPFKYSPTCGNNKQMYPNECELKLDACRKGKLKEIKAVDKRKCEDQCSYQCPEQEDKVCGDDFITYLNECMLHKQNCKSEYKISVKSKGPCETPEAYNENHVPSK